MFWSQRVSLHIYLVKLIESWWLTQLHMSTLSGICWGCRLMCWIEQPSLMYAALDRLNWVDTTACNDGCTCLCVTNRISWRSMPYWPDVFAANHWTGQEGTFGPIWLLSEVLWHSLKLFKGKTANHCTGKEFSISIVNVPSIYLYTECNSLNFNHSSQPKWA